MDHVLREHGEELAPGLSCKRRATRSHRTEREATRNPFRHARIARAAQRRPAGCPPAALPRSRAGNPASRRVTSAPARCSALATRKGSGHAGWAGPAPRGQVIWRTPSRARRRTGARRVEPRGSAARPRPQRLSGSGRGQGATRIDEAPLEPAGARTDQPGVLEVHRRSSSLGRRPSARPQSASKRATPARAAHRRGRAERGAERGDRLAKPWRCPTRVARDDGAARSASRSSPRRGVASAPSAARGLRRVEVPGFAERAPPRPPRGPDVTEGEQPPRRIVERAAWRAGMWASGDLSRCPAPRDAQRRAFPARAHTPGGAASGSRRAAQIGGACAGLPGDRVELGACAIARPKRFQRRPPQAPAGSSRAGDAGAVGQGPHRSGKATRSWRMRKLKASPPAPQPKQ